MTESTPTPMGNNVCTLLLLEQQILTWAKSRDLLEFDAKQPQGVKLREELLESIEAREQLGHSKGLDHKKTQNLMMELGDVMVCCTVLLHLFNSSISLASVQFALQKLECDADSILGYLDRFIPSQSKTRSEVEFLFCCCVAYCNIQSDYQLIECVDMAYKKIKDRKGKTINGFFIKEGDIVPQAK